MDITHRVVFLFIWLVSLVKMKFTFYGGSALEADEISSAEIGQPHNLLTYVRKSGMEGLDWQTWVALQMFKKRV